MRDAKTKGVSWILLIARKKPVKVYFLEFLKGFH